MFPLEQALLPTSVIPLHIFEERYRELARAVAAKDEPEFGTAMIERGREVGGEDQRSTVGVILRVLEAEEFDDGRWGIVSAATRRIRIHEWLTDAPYPRATVENWPDTDADTYIDDLDSGAANGLRSGIDRILAAATRIDPRRPIPTITLADDPAQATWQAASSAGLGPIDAMRLLEEPSAATRLALAVDLIADRAAVLEALADEAG